MEHNHSSHGASCHSNSTHSACGHSRSRVDWLLWGSLTAIAAGLAFHFLSPAFVATGGKIAIFAHSIAELLSRMWWGVLLGIFFVGLLSHVPRDAVMKVLGKSGSVSGILRACLAGVLLDLCSHGILLVGMKLYERGAGIGQVMAFLIASPWNSISLTIIMISLMGLKWTLVFIALSAVIAIASGLLFQMFVKRGILPENPNKAEIDKDYKLSTTLKAAFRWKNLKPNNLSALVWGGMKESRMVLRWLFFGVVLAAAIRATMPEDAFATYFGATALGLFLTILAATIIEVCSEGSTPIAADLLTRANAPGNSFAFLMTGVATDYTEIMGIKETTRSWKIALFLPLICVPQVLALAWILNQFGG